MALLCQANIRNQSYNQILAAHFAGGNTSSPMQKVLTEI